MPAASLKLVFASQELRHAARRKELDLPGFAFCDFPQRVWGWGRRGNSTAAPTTGFYDWAFDKHSQHRPGKLERPGQRYGERLERLFRKRASDAFRGSGRSDQQSGESFFRQFRAGGLRDNRRVAPPRDGGGYDNPAGPQWRPLPPPSLFFFPFKTAWSPTFP